ILRLSGENTGVTAAGLLAPCSQSVNSRAIDRSSRMTFGCALLRLAPTNTEALPLGAKAANWLVGSTLCSCPVSGTTACTSERIALPAGTSRKNRTLFPSGDQNGQEILPRASRTGRLSAFQETYQNSHPLSTLRPYRHPEPSGRKNGPNATSSAMGRRDPRRNSRPRRTMAKLVPEQDSPKAVTSSATVLTL